MDTKVLHYGDWFRLACSCCPPLDCNATMLQSLMHDELSADGIAGRILWQSPERLVHAVVNPVCIQRAVCRLHCWQGPMAKNILSAWCMQVYETQTELTEAREELELMKLKLEVADQEAQAAKRQAAEATAATAALLQAHDSPGLLSPVNRRSLSREVGSMLPSSVKT